jgi:tRNA (guanine-N7-)-methyltransferase
MAESFRYIPYRSRRNISVKNKENINLLAKYCHSNPIEYLKQTKKNINLEIGFGSGDFILKEALQNTNDIYLGCEVYNPGIMSLTRKLEKYNVKNVCICNRDAREFLIATQDMLFKNIYILFPDPWPKKKHHKRRLINKDFLQFIKTKFKFNIYIATDHEKYAESILYDSLKNHDYRIKRLEVKKDKYFNTKFENKAISKSSDIFSIVLEHTQ